MTTPPALEARGITKAFPGVLANDHVDFRLERGEIHALLGENGAGKTTLMNILYGLYQQDEGQVLINGREVDIHNPNEAIAHGIGMVHQHFMLVPVMTVAENIMLGIEPCTGRSRWLRLLGLLDHHRVEARVRELSTQHGLEVDPTALVQTLSVGAQQRVEIMKALYREANILILDEPTAVLTPQESDELFLIMRSLAERGTSIIFITHKLKEVFAVADHITVMRDGQVVGTTTPAEATEQQLASMMVGREVLLRISKGSAHPGKAVLAVDNLLVRDSRDHEVVRGVSFQVHASEILGIAGVQGNGQTELVEALTGLRSASSGHMRIGDQTLDHASPRQILEQGVAHIPEDRQKRGLVLRYPVRDNLVLGTYYQPPYAQGIVMQHAAIEENAQNLIEEFDIRTPSSTTLTGSLSGGNQQKVIVARELSRSIKLLIAAQPTRGLDVGSIEFIHRRLIEQRDAGYAVLLVSAELDEIMALSDRVAVMYKGKIIDILPIEKATREELGLLMAGVGREGGNEM